MMESLGADDAASFLKMSKASLLRKARRGDIPGHKPGRSWVFIKEDLIAFIREKAQQRKLQPKRTHFEEVVVSCQSNDAKVAKSTIQTSHITARELESLLAQPTNC